MIKLGNPVDLFKLSVPVRNINNVSQLEENFLVHLNNFINKAPESSIPRQANELAVILTAKYSDSTVQPDVTLREYLDDPTVERDTKLRIIIEKLDELQKSNKPNQDIIAQLGCDLLVLEDVQTAIKIFQSIKTAELSNQLKFSYDYALALSQSTKKADNESAIEIFQKLKTEGSEKLQNNAVDINKVISLLVTIFDKLEMYTEAESHCQQIDRLYKPNHTYEQLILVKYAYKQHELIPKSQQFAECVTKPLKAITDKDEDIANIMNNNVSLDIIYLIGLGYLAKTQLQKAAVFFSKVVENYNETTTYLINPESYASFQILTTFIITKNTDQVISCLETMAINPNWLPIGLELTPLILAADDLQTNIANILLSHEADPFYICNSLSDRTPVHFAVSVRNDILLAQIAERISNGSIPLPEHHLERDIELDIPLEQNNDILDNPNQLAKYLDIMGYDTMFQHTHNS